MLLAEIKLTNDRSFCNSFEIIPHKQKNKIHQLIKSIDRPLCLGAYCIIL